MKPKWRISSTQTATKHLPTFACMQTIHVARIREDEGQDLFLELLTQIHEVRWDKHIQRVTRVWDVGPAGHFTITFNTTKSKEIIEKIWNVKVKEGRLGYEMIGENPQREFELKLDRLPEEVPTEAMDKMYFVLVPHDRMYFDLIKYMSLAVPLLFAYYVGLHPHGAFLLQ